MMKWLKKLFAKKIGPSCVGEECVDVIDSFGRTVARLHYEQPSGDMLLEFIDRRMTILEGADDAEKVRAAGDGHEVKAIYQIFRDELFIPFAERVFSRSEGYKTKDGRDVGALEKAEQFDHIKRYFPGHLSDMCAAAFEARTTVKKKF